MSYVWTRVSRPALGVFGPGHLQNLNSTRPELFKWSLLAARVSQQPSSNIKSLAVRADLILRQNLACTQHCRFTTHTQYAARRSNTAARNARPFDHARVVENPQLPNHGDGIAQAPSASSESFVDTRALPDQPYSKQQIQEIFGSDRSVDQQVGNWIISVLHERRTSGSLAEAGLSPPSGFEWSKSAAANALQWLRLHHPIDEEAAAAQWAEAEAYRLQQELYVERGQKLGLLKKDDNFSTAKSKRDRESLSDLYGRGALQELREHHQKRLEEDEKDAKDGFASSGLEDGAGVQERSERGLEETQELAWRKEQSRLLKARRQRSPGDAASETEPEPVVPSELKTGKQQVSRRDIPNSPQSTQIGQVRKESERMRQYRERAVLSDSPEPPQMTKFARIGPATLVTGLIIAISVLFATIYQPPTFSDRLLPMLPASVATCLLLVGLNLGVFVAWRIPPLWRVLNKYGTVAPGYPYAVSVLGNIFSHQEFSHFAVNMAMLLSLGVQLHELVGRGNFLALYIGCGVFGTWFSLTTHVLRGVLFTSSLGASGAIYGMLGAYAFLLPDHMFPLKVPFSDWKWDVWTMPLLVFLYFVEFFGIVVSRGQLDHYVHIGGLTAGVISAQALQWRASSGAARAEETRSRRDS